MTDLEKLLLEAAGRTSTTGRNRHSPPPSKRRRRGSYSDDSSSDSRDNYSDDNRSSQEEGDDEDGNDDDSIGSDLYKDEEDRRKLAKMSELEREIILAERATKKTDRKLQENVRKQNEKMTESRKASTPPKISCGVRSSVRSADLAASRDGVLNELRAKRQRQQDPETRWKPKSTTIKGRNIESVTTLRSSSSSESGSSSDDKGSTSSDDNKTSIDSNMPTFEDIKEITIRRSKLGNWFMEPFFEELIAGCFVRVGIGRSKSGPVYRLCIVKNVDAANPNSKYKLENKTTHKYLNVFWGNESTAARWQMAMMSDSPPLKEEYDLWVKEVKRSGGHMPSKQDVIEKKGAIERTKTFVYSAETVKKMLQGKQSRPLKVAVEKERLRREMEAAESKKDEVAVEMIKKRVQELEEKREAYGNGDGRAIMLEGLNRRNRIDSFRSTFEKKAEVNKNLKAGEDGYDACSRRWTRSRNCYYGSTPVEEVKAAAASKDGTATALPVSEGNEGVGGVSATAAALEETADAGKLENPGSVLKALHNFDLPISLSVLDEFGGPKGVQAALVVRRQKIEATVRCQVPENDRRKHGLTLTVDDYRRRRGLL